LATKSKVYYLFWKIFEDILHKAYTLEKLLPQETKKLIEHNKILLGAIKSGDVAAVDKAVALHQEEDKFFSDLLKDLGPERRRQLK
jgi:DNA-binding FadR family transcriptional regulator